MSNLPANPIEVCEHSFRAAKKSVPNHYNISENRVSSALFKQSNGVSVNRCLQQGPDDCVNQLEAAFCNDLNVIVKITIEQCLSIGVYVEPDPRPDNIYHANIFNSQAKDEIKSGKAKRLASSCRVVRVY